MKSIFIPRKLNIGDTARLADQDSAHLITEGKTQVESILDIQTPFAIHKSRVVFIDRASIEVEILSVDELPEGDTLPEISIIQGISQKKRFNYFFEKIVEVGITNIFPIETEYSNLKKSGSQVNFRRWKKIVHEAKKQSRTRYTSKLWDIRDLEKVLAEKPIQDSQIKICLTTEADNAKGIQSFLRASSSGDNKGFVIAVGPEKGWSPEEISLFKNMGFKFAHLGDNILRTETAGVIATSLINYIVGQYN